MTKLKILHYPDSRLHLKAKPVETFDDSLKQLIADMAEIMYANNGIGLAATQVNIQRRIFIMDLAVEGEDSQLMALINPAIIKKSGEISCEEGCLSVPGVFESVKRSAQITLTYYDVNGKEHTLECDDLKAICIQHEIDHLDGKVFVDYLSTLKQNFIKKKMKKLFQDEQKS